MLRSQSWGRLDDRLEHLPVFTRGFGAARPTKEVLPRLRSGNPVAEPRQDMLHELQHETSQCSGRNRGAGLTIGLNIFQCLLAASERPGPRKKFCRDCGAEIPWPNRGRICCMN